jgi:glycosyltransferase involved in cell wall biosynthesis
MMQETGNPRIKVLFLSAWYPYEDDSMFGLFVRKLALSVSSVCDVMVVHTRADISYKAKYSVVKNEEAGLKEIYVYYKKPEGFIGKIHGFIRWIKAYRIGFKTMRTEWGLPDITHVNILTRTAFPALYLKIRHKIPYVVSEHWSRYLPFHDNFRGIFRRYLTKIAIKNASALTVVSDQLGKAMIMKGLTKNYTLLPNVIDNGLFQVNKEKTPGDIKIIVHISCFEDRSKNMSGLLKAVKILSEKRIDFQLRMIGTGADFEATVKLATELEILDKFVVFDGLKEGRELADILSNADLSVLPSAYETFGIVVFESLSCGVPVLVSNVADLGFLIKPPFGRVLSDIYPETIAKYIDLMLDELPAYDVLEMRKFVLENYSEEEVIERIVSIYKKYLNT